MFLVLFLGCLAGLITKIIITVKNNKEKDREPSENELKNESITKIMPVINYDPEHDLYVKRDGTYMDLIEALPADLANESEDAILMRKLRLTKLYKLYADDLKIVTINLPANTRVQQEYIRKKIASTRNSLHKKYLREKERELIWIETNRTKREFYFMIFADNINDLVERRDMVTSIMGTGRKGMVELIEPEKKDMILHTMLNKNEYLMEE